MHTDVVSGGVPFLPGGGSSLQGGSLGTVPLHEGRERRGAKREEEEGEEPKKEEMLPVLIYHSSSQANVANKL